MQAVAERIDRDEYMKSKGFNLHKMIGLEMWTHGECHITDRLVYDIEEGCFKERIDEIIRGLGG